MHTRQRARRSRYIRPPSITLLNTANYGWSRPQGKEGRETNHGNAQYWSGNQQGPGIVA